MATGCRGSLLSFAILDRSPFSRKVVAGGTVVASVRLMCGRTSVVMEPNPSHDGFDKAIQVNSMADSTNSNMSTPGRRAKRTIRHLQSAEARHELELRWSFVSGHLPSSSKTAITAKLCLLWHHPFAFAFGLLQWVICRGGSARVQLTKVGLYGWHGLCGSASREQ